MEKLKVLLDEANKSIKSASHMLYVTYPLVKDTKLFMGILENINKALQLSMNALLYYERMYKRINPFHDNFNVKLDVFRRVVSRRYNISNDVPNLIMEINEIIRNRKAAPIEIAKKTEFVICDKEYRTRALKHEELKNYFLKAKVFILQTSNIVNAGANI